MLLTFLYRSALNYSVYNIFSHLRFLLKCADELATKAPTLAELQNQATTATAVTSSIQSELSVVSENQNKDHATIQEERDGRLNEE
jgi:hypothetical protein